MKRFFLLLLGLCTPVLAQEGKSAGQAPSFTECSPVPDPCCIDFPPIFNEGARIEPKGHDIVFATVDFLYWYAEQEGMDLAINVADVNPTGTQLSAIEAFQKFEYKPGFKIGLGVNFDYDRWVGMFEYTWFHMRTHTFSPPKQQFPGAPPSVWNLRHWLVNGAGSGSPLQYENFESLWNLHIDFLDASLMRPFYQGRRVIVTPYFGLRGGWIHQSLVLRSSDVHTIPLPFALDVPSAVSRNSSSAYFIGPRFGLDGKWFLTKGFRLQANGATSLLFTGYPKVTHKEKAIAIRFAAMEKYYDKAKFENFITLRPITEFGLGLGWGSYFGCDSYHFDISANYDFVVMWSQNMMRALVDCVVTSTRPGPSAANLTLNGLTLQTRLDF